MSIQSVFSGAGGSQIVLYEAYTPSGGYVDTMGVGATFTQPTTASRPSADTSVAPSGATMLLFDGVDDVVGDGSTSGVIASGSFPTWTAGNIIVEHFIIRRTASPNNSTEARIVDYNGNEYWLLNTFGAGYLYRTGSNTDSNPITAASTVYYITIEHNVSTGISTSTVNGVTQADTGGNDATTRTDLLADKCIGARENAADPYAGHIGCYGIGYGTTWGSTERAALYSAMYDWYNGLNKFVSVSGLTSLESFGRATVNSSIPSNRRLFRQFPSVAWSRARSAPLAGRMFPGLSIVYGTTKTAPAQTLAEREFWGSIIAPTGIASAQAFGTATISLGGGGGSQNVSPTGIPSAQAFGLAQLNRTVRGTGITTAEQLGNAKINLRTIMTGIASLEAMGAAKLNINAKPTGIATAEVIGTAKLNRNAKPTGIVTAEAIGTARVTSNVKPTGIATGETVGTAKLNRTAPMTGIASAQAFGSSKLNVNVKPTGIASAEATGSASVTTGPVSIRPTGIATTETIGAAKLNQNIKPTGIASAQAFGLPRFTIYVRPTGIASVQAFGSTTVVPGPKTLSPTGIASAQAFGAPTITLGGNFIFTSGVASAEAFGTARFTIKVLPTGITSGQAFGASRFTVNVKPTGIGSAQAMGSPVVNVGGVTLRPTAIGSSEAFGAALLSAGAAFVAPAGIPSAEAFGSSSLHARNTLTINAIGSGEAFGAGRFVYAQTLAALSIPSGEAFGTIVFSGGAVPLPPFVRWSQRPATTIVVRFRPATIIKVSQRAATLITVRQKKMPLYVDDVNEAVFTFQHPDTKAFIDPPSVLLVVQSPTQKKADPEQATTYTFGVGSVITRNDVGKYTARIPCTEAGSWSGAPKCTGNAASSSRFTFDVEAKLGS